MHSITTGNPTLAGPFGENSFALRWEYAHTYKVYGAKIHFRVLHTEFDTSGVYSVVCRRVALYMVYSTEFTVQHIHRYIQRTRMRQPTRMNG
jgi:hypothetical protein